MRSAISGSFCMVAGLELTRMTSKPSARSARQACEPEKSNSAAWPILIGPEPRIMIRWMSSRRGIRQHLAWIVGVRPSSPSPRFPRSGRIAAPHRVAREPPRGDTER
uniref:Uncharacterized protein n=1 Tax=uncultured marine group II/III euryarchaeote KM3_41_F08 TaxID=1456446 RepID=A0A075H423_9EURY|nr:hypothetical protein [uncultured marine group II/III euryarchaeote KM3_41_F08]